MMNESIAIIIGYFLGSVPFAYIFGKLFKGIDIRKYGTKNPGASNVFLLAGVFAGILTLVGDAGKGYLAILIAKNFGVSDYFIVVTGIAAVFGHIYPAFLMFKGGKGVATTLGVFLALLPTQFLITIAILVAFIFTLKRIMLSSLIALSIFPIIAFLFHKPIVFVLGIVFLVVLRWIIDFKNLNKIGGNDYKNFINKLKGRNKITVYPKNQKKNSNKNNNKKRVKN